MTPTNRDYELARDYAEEQPDEDGEPMDKGDLFYARHEPTDETY